MAGGDKYDIGTGIYGEAGFFIVRPRMYMNTSGRAVLDFLREHPVSFGRILVICDDFNLPLGKIRIRRSGSDGGHNGLASVIDVLQTEEIPRLRVGIGEPPANVDVVEYVLGDFVPDEEPVIEEAVGRAVDAVLSLVTEGWERTMSAFN